MRPRHGNSTDACADFYQHVCGGFATVEHVAPDRGEALWSTDRASTANTAAIQELLAGTLLDNVLAARVYEQQRSWTRSRAERSRESWENIVYPNAAEGMAAARLTIPNAFPDIVSNSIVFTAAFLRSPLVDGSASPEVLYGMFGAVAGHEIIHVVEMHEFDSLGEQRDTWAPTDAQAHAAGIVPVRGVVARKSLESRLTCDRRPRTDGSP